MRIALLTSARGWRGSLASYAKIARGLSERGHVAQLMTVSPKLAGHLAAEGLETVRLPPRRTRSQVLALRRALRAVGAQAVLADTWRDVRLAAVATLLQPARIVYRCGAGYLQIGRHWLDPFCRRRLRACVYQSNWAREQSRRHAPWLARLPAFDVPNGYDLARYRPDAAAGQRFRERYRIAPGAPVLMTAARLTRNKGHDVALATINRLRREGLEVVYVVAGDGGLEGELVSMAQSYGLPVVFTGLLPSQQLIEAYNAADVVLHPSLEEIFPNAVGEAMACGRPVIAADAGGTGELLGRLGTTGVLVPPGDASALAAEVRVLLHDSDRRQALGAAARRRVQDEFPLARMIHGYETLLAEVVGGSR